MINNKKAIAPLIIGLVALVVLLGGFMTYKSYASPSSQGVPATPPPSYVGFTPVTPPVPQCPAGQFLNNNLQCVIPPCPTGTVRNIAGGCDALVNPITPNPINPGYTPNPSASCTPTGYIKEAFAYHKNNVGKTSDTFGGAPLSMVFVVTNECDANFYFESGLQQTGQLFSFLVTQPSACDGNNHYAGKFISGNKNTQFNTGHPPGEISIAFFPQDYGKQEVLNIVGGVYTGCYKGGGKAIQEVPPQKLTLSNSYSTTSVVDSFTKII